MSVSAGFYIPYFVSKICIFFFRNDYIDDFMKFTMYILNIYLYIFISDTFALY